MSQPPQEIAGNRCAPENHARIPALDGVRGIAVLLVASFHLTFVGLAAEHAAGGALFHKLAKLAQWGWTGVDLFFVLSGFLITGILVDAKGSPRYFRGFYARRALRIFPAYYLLLVIILLIVPALSPKLAHGALKTFGPRSIYWLYVSNLYFAYRGIAGGVLSHTWSLAIEEQFYLVWPAVVLLLSRRAMLGTCVVLVIVSAVLRTILLARGWDFVAISFVTICRLDSLACGAIIALVWRQLAGPHRVKLVSTFALTLAPLAMIFVRAAHARLDPTGFVKAAIDPTLIAATFAGFIGLAVVGSRADRPLLRPSALARGLSIPPLRFLGKYSYGIYLIHLPLIVAVYELGIRPQSTRDRIAYLIVMPLVIVALALVSWHGYEKQFLKLKPPRR